MDEGSDEEQGEFAIRPIGERLRLAREAAGRTIEEVAAETRISVRHLGMIEAGKFAGLPGRTYALGFSRTIAKNVGLDPDEVAEAVRAELGESDRDGHRSGAFEPGDPARMPSARLGWISAAAALVILLGTFFLFRSYFDPEGDLPRLEAPPAKPVPAARSGRPPARTGETVEAGGVVFTAMEQGIWVKFYDANGRQLMQKQMALGERFRIPDDADGPQLWTGRPDALAITVGGKRIPRLAEEEKVMRDVLVTPEALLARPPASPPAPARDSPTG